MKKKTFSILFLLLMAFLPLLAAEDVPVIPSSMDAVSVLAPSADYLIQPDDVLQISVYEEPELTTSVRVSSQGEIDFPLLGRLSIGGWSVSKLQSELTRLLEADYLVNPQVQVYIQSYHNRTVSVTGAVNKPGSYQIPPGKPTTMMEVIAMAGGFSKVAAVNKVRIIRSEAGGARTIEVNAKDIVQKGNKSKDVEVQPADVIFVPESWL